MHQYSDYRWLRGFNVIPSWAARIEQAWWDYDPVLFREEVALARGVHANCIRLWIEYSAWMVDPDKICDRFLDAVSAIDEAGMKTMPCLFNRWHDMDFDYGGTYPHSWFYHPQANERYKGLQQHVHYVRHLVEPLKSDPRILMWDLCNEPQSTDWNKKHAAHELHWLARMADTVRRTGAEQPITIGTMLLHNIELYAPLCDVLCCHPYGTTRESLEVMIRDAADVSARHEKPMHSNETIPGALDDLRRAEVARWTIPMMEDAGFGWMGWGLREGRTVSTRRDRFDPNGVDGEGFHAWFTRDGQLREGLEFLREEPRYRAPWET